MYYPVCRFVHIKEPLLLIGKSINVVTAAGFLSHYLSGPLPYVLSVWLNKNIFFLASNRTGVIPSHQFSGGYKKEYSGFKI